MHPELEFDSFLARLRTGDPQAALEFYERYSRVVKGAARRYLASQPDLRPLVDSDDLSQEAWRTFFKAVLDGRLSLDGDDHTRRTLAQFAQHVAQNEHHRQHRRQRNVGSIEALAAPDNVPSRGPGAEEVIAERDAAEALLGGLDPQDQRIVASHYSGDAYDQIAEREGLTTEAVRSRFRRAMQRLGDHAHSDNMGEPADPAGGGARSLRAGVEWCRVITLMAARDAEDFGDSFEIRDFSDRCGGGMDK